MSQPMILQLTVRLVGSEPVIWRQLEIGEDVTLADLHIAIQACMDWENAHAHQFRVGRRFFGPSDNLEMDENTENEEQFSLAEVFTGKNTKIYYDYDFGDNWQHEIVLNGKSPLNEDLEYPRCTGGARAAPPEDCGGIPGYENLLLTLKDPKHPDHEDLMDWLGDENFDPERFSIAEVNERLLFASDNDLDEFEEEDENDEDDETPIEDVEEAVADMILRIVETQVERNSPPVAGTTLERLAEAGLDEDEAWDLMAAAYTLETYQAFVDHREFDMDAYSVILQGLPKLPGK